MVIRRRLFLKISGAALLGGCVPNAPLDRIAPAAKDAETDPDAAGRDVEPPDAGESSADAARTDATVRDPDSGFEDSGMCDRFVIMHDTYAQALYLDGTLGPLTGIIHVDDVLRNEPIELEFWHGHGGLLHRFTLLPEHFDRLKRGERVTLTTTELEQHRHELFIDPLDPMYQVPGSTSIEVPLC